MSVDSILQKVGNLRRLAEGAGTQAEAEAALAQAAAIMQKYRITEAEVELGSSVRAEEPELSGEALHLFGQRSVTWRTTLGATVGAHFGCYVYEHSRPRDPAAGRALRQVTLEIVGRASDVTMARYVFAWADAEITRLVASESGKAARNAFCHGCVRGFRDALKRGAEGAAWEAQVGRAGAGGAAIALVGRLEASKEAAERAVGGKFKTQTSAGPSDVGAYQRGKMRPAAGLEGGGAARMLAEKNG